MSNIASTVPIPAPPRIAQLTAGDVCLAALQDLGVYAARETQVKQSDQALALRHLNAMLDEWTADGANQWRVDDAELPWPAGTFELAPGMDGVSDITDVSIFTRNYSRPLARWDWPDMQRLANQAAYGDPTAFSVILGLDGPRLRLWPQPATDVTLRVIYVRENASVTSVSDVIDVPVKWQSTVIANLASRLAGPFQVQALNADLSDRAAILYQRLRADDRPPSYFINGSAA